MRRLAVLLAPLILASCATTSVDSGTATSRKSDHRLPLSPCTDEAYEGLLCGTYEVFEDRQARSGRTLDLRVVVAPATGPNPKPDPLFYFMGGPGGGAAESAGFGLGGLQVVNESRDIVYIDQRGTGASNRLDCPFYAGGATKPQVYLDPMLKPAQVEACRDELSERADLTLYTTAIGMDDIDDVRRWLGYETINLFGGSYGTRAAQVYMRRHPDSVRTAILAGVTGFDQHLPLYHARDATRAMHEIFADCAEDAACAEAFPDFRKKFDEVVRRLGQKAAPIELPATEDRPAATVFLTREIFVETVRFLMYSPQSASALPLLIDQAHQWEFRPFAQIATVWMKNLDQLLAWGMWLSVTCAEDIPYIEESAVRKQTADTYLGTYRIRRQQQACRMWPRAEIATDFHQPLRSNKPVLLMSGNLDPVTPPVWAESVSKGLPNSFHVVVDESHHGSQGLENGECLMRVMREFLDEGSADDLDLACVETVRRPGFITDPEALQAILDAWDP